MKLFFIALIFINYSALAQLHQASVKADLKEEMDRSSFFYSFTNKSNDQTCLLMVGRTVVKGFVINKTGEILNQFSLPKTSKRILPIGGYFDNDKVYMLFGKDASVKEISNYCYTFSSNKIDSSVIAPDFSNKSVFSIINTGNGVLFACTDKKQPIISLYHISNADSIKNEQYDLSKLTNLPYDGKEFYLRLRKFPLQYIDAFKQKSPVQLFSRNKLYYRNDSLIFTLDKKGQSELLFIDRQAKTCTYKTLEQNIDYCDKEKEVLNLNSCLLNNDLYYVKVCHEGLQLNVTNIVTGNALAKFVCEGDKPLSFKNTMFMKMNGKENKSDFDKESDIIWNQQTFLRRASAKEFLVAAERDTSGNILLRTGSFDITTLKERQQEMFSMFPVIGLLPSLAGVLIIDIIQPPDWSSTVYFQSKLNAATYQHVQGNMQPMTEEKIAAVMAKQKIKPQHRHLLKYQGASYFVYYDKETDSLVFSEI